MEWEETDDAPDADGAREMEFTECVYPHPRALDDLPAEVIARVLGVLPEIKAAAGANEPGEAWTAFDPAGGPFDGGAIQAAWECGLCRLAFTTDEQGGRTWLASLAPRTAVEE